MAEAANVQWRGILLGAVIAVAPAALAADEAPPGLVALLKVTGECLDISVARQKLGDGCTGELGMAVYADGRTGFHFMMRNGHIFSVSGLHAENGRNSVKIDRVVFNTGIEVNKPDVIVARGHCSYGDPYRGRMTVRCSGTIGRAQDFIASFETDGKPPVEERI